MTTDREKVQHAISLLHSVDPDLSAAVHLIQCEADQMERHRAELMRAMAHVTDGNAHLRRRLAWLAERLRGVMPHAADVAEGVRDVP